MQPPQPPYTDPEPSPASEPDPHQPTQSTAIPGRSPRRQRPAWIVPSVVTSIATILLVAVLAHLALGVPLPFGLSDPPPVPADWQTYHDPAGLFSIRLPPNWTVHIYSGTANFGDRTGSASDTQEELNFTDPAQGNASPWVSIYAAPISTAFERHWYCQAFPARFFANHSFFQGLPAQSDTNGGWLLETAHAHFQIDAAIRPYIKGLGIEPPPPTPTPLPPDTAAADRTLIDTILGSFQPTDPHTLSCP